MTASRRRFSREFKDELCREVIATSKPIGEVADAYGVGAGAAAEAFGCLVGP